MGMSADRSSPVGAGFDDGDSIVIRRSLEILGLRWDRRAGRRLTAGRSGSLVVSVLHEGRPAVLKVTTDPSWLARAELELNIIRILSERAPAFVPRFLTGHSGPDSIEMLTERCEPYPAAAELTVGNWTELAAQLGRLHRLWPGGSPGLDLEPRSRPDAQQLAQACDQWAQLGHGPAARRAAAVLTERGTEAPNLPTALTHGDCHTENVVCNPDGGPCWVDWQEACSSDGMDDLAFLWQRAEFSWPDSDDGGHRGGGPPREAMVDAYSEARQIAGDDGLRQALCASELRLLLVSWPPFLRYGTPPAQSRMARRLTELSDIVEGV